VQSKSAQFSCDHNLLSSIRKFVAGQQQIKMVFTAKWRLVSVENAEAFQKKIKTNPEFWEKLKAIYAELPTNPDAYIEEITVDKAAGTVHRVVFIKGDKKRDSGVVKVNEEFEHTSADGRKLKGKITFEGENTLVFHDKGPEFEATITLVLNGDDLTATLKCEDVVSVEKFKRV